MKDYKRLTFKRLVDPYDDDCEENENATAASYEELLNRLAELEDKIENGTLVEPPCCNKNIKFYFNRKEIPFEELSEIPQMVTDRENHTITEIVLHYIGKDAIYFYTKTEHYTVADGADEEYYDEM
nr:MAG TPA: hypothetical protein [Caudoviricetes sp.]